MAFKINVNPELNWVKYNNKTYERTLQMVTNQAKKGS